MWKCGNSLFRLTRNEKPIILKKKRSNSLTIKQFFQLK